MGLFRLKKQMQARRCIAPAVVPDISQRFCLLQELALAICVQVIELRSTILGRLTSAADAPSAGQGQIK